MLGGTSFVGAVSSAATTAVGLEATDVDPPTLLAVTTTTTVCPTSLAVSS